MRNSYYTTLYLNPQIRLKWFLPLIKRAVETGKSITTTEAIPLNGYDYTIYFKPVVEVTGEGEYREITLTLKWEDEGESYTQEIWIVARESNLISGSFVYYFYCPVSGICKKLFYIGNRFKGRRAFRHIYGIQRQSRKWRELSEPDKEPYRRYGKRFYRDRITPYGKRCRRFEEKEERQYKALLYFIDKMGKRRTKKK